MEFILRIAVNIVDDVSIHQADDDVRKFLGIENKNIPVHIDYYVCNSTSNNSIIDNSAGTSYRIFNSVAAHESNVESLIKTPLNENIVNKSSLLIRRMYRSYINSIRMSKQLYYNYYSFVISYSLDLSKFLLSDNQLRPAEIGYMFCLPDHINNFQNQLDGVDYKTYLCSLTDFLKLVQVWKHIEYLNDSHYNIWNWFKVKDDIGEEIMNKWCYNQRIQIRHLHD